MSEQKRTTLDAAESVFFERELEHVRAKSYDVKYPQFKARQLIPLDSTVPTGAETVKYNQYDITGVAKILANFSTDMQRVDVKGAEFRQAVKSIGDAYGYNIQEIRAAKMAGMPLEQRRANAARLVCEMKIDALAAAGDSDNGLQGFLAITNASTYTIPNGAAGQTTWTTKTGLEILADMTKAVNRMIKLTNEVEQPDTIVLPTDQYGLISTLPLQTGSSVTILQHFLASNPYIKAVVPWFKCAGAGASATDRMVVYRRDPDALQLVIPQEFESFPPEARGLEFVISCHMRYGGVVCYYPMSVLYADGI